MKTRLPTPAHEEITARARYLWQIAGNPAGRDLEFWLAAEAELRYERTEVTRAAEASDRGLSPTAADAATAMVAPSRTHRRRRHR